MFQDSRPESFRRPVAIMKYWLEYREYTQESNGLIDYLRAIGNSAQGLFGQIVQADKRDD
jgi:hypothetical protein